MRCSVRAVGVGVGGSPGLPKVCLWMAWKEMGAGLPAGGLLKVTLKVPRVTLLLLAVEGSSRNRTFLSPK